MTKLHAFDFVFAFINKMLRHCPKNICFTGLVLL